MKRTWIAGAAAAILATIGLGAAFADGYFPGFPIVGGASYCSGYSQAGVPGTTAVCNVTVPAGPTALTGDETIVADTHLSQGRSPQTVAIDITSLGAGPYQYNVPVTTDSITILPGTRRLQIEPAGTLAALTVVFPAASGLTDGQLFGLCTTQIITALTLTAGSGTTIMNGPTALLVPVATGGASCVEWFYNKTTTKWYRTQ